jgi:hypothetical protein
MAGATAILAMTAATAHALTLQPIGSFKEPIYVTSDPGNPERLFVVERKGTVVQVQNGEVRPFADISSRVFHEPEDERGLLSIALAPDFDLSGRFYLDYTGKAEPGEIHVAEMVAGGSGAPISTLRDVVPPIPHPGESNHYGGQLQFGPEGALFISAGDGGGSDDEHHNSQNPGSFLGKILRVMPVAGTASTPTIWSLGLRNPFRFSFDRLTGGLWIGDVGQEKREEVDFAPAPSLGQGANYGWNCMEGGILGPATDEPQCAENAGVFTPPVFEYPHENPGGGKAHGCAIIGGYVVRGPGMGELFGRYVYGDLCVGDIRSFSIANPKGTDRFEGVNVSDLNSFGEDSCGRLYAVSGNGPVYRLLGPESAPCSAKAPSPAPQYEAELAPSYVGIRAVSRQVKRHRRGLISVWATPCNGRRGNPITLWRGQQQLGTRRLDRACTARFRPRIDRRSTFRATVKETQTFLPAISRKVTIKPVRRHRRHR